MKKNHFSAAATASNITKVPVEVIRAGFRKGAKPTGNVLNAVIVARQLYNGAFRKAAATELFSAGGFGFVTAVLLALTGLPEAEEK